MERFQKQLGIPVVFTSGKSGHGVDKLMEKVVEISKQSPLENNQHRLLFDKEIESNIENLKNKLKNEKSYEKSAEKISC